MHFSPVFKSSPLCLASPDGQWIASVAQPSATAPSHGSGHTSISISIRSTFDLQLSQPARLPADASAPVITILWSASSSSLLVLTPQAICVFTVSEAGLSLHATIKNPILGPGKPSHVQFGHDDGEVIVFSTHGLKVLIFNLSTAKAVEISNPKWHNPVSASRTYSIRPQSGHLALLTRTGGKDMLSIHDPATRQLQRSWSPETNDAQAVSWTPDGQWLLVWDAAIHGRHLYLYTSDGHLFRDVDLDPPRAGPRDVNASANGANGANGIKQCKFSPNAAYCVVCSHGPGVSVLATGSWRRIMTLVHPQIVAPGDTTQVWQEQSGSQSLTQTGAMRLHTEFVRATHAVSPPTSVSSAKLPRDALFGCSSARFDASSNLLATKLEESPTTLWIWDLAAAELRAVLVFHSTVDFDWHPSVRELLLISHSDDAYRGPLFVWDPLSQGPRPVDLEDSQASGRSASRTRGSWLNTSSEIPALLVANDSRYCLVSVADDDSRAPYWQHSRDITSVSVQDGSSDQSAKVADPRQVWLGEHDSSLVDDTFSFKRS